jgi:hypothetical protein
VGGVGVGRVGVGGVGAVSGACCAAMRKRGVSAAVPQRVSSSAGEDAGLRDSVWLE